MKHITDLDSLALWRGRWGPLIHPTALRTCDSQMTSETDWHLLASIPVSPQNIYRTCHQQVLC